MFILIVAYSIASVISTHKKKVVYSLMVIWEIWSRWKCELLNKSKTTQESHPSLRLPLNKQ